MRGVVLEEQCCVKWMSLFVLTVLSSDEPVTWWCIVMMGCVLAFTHRSVGGCGCPHLCTVTSVVVSGRRNE